MKLPAELKPEDVVAICDIREQHPLDLKPLQVVRGTLPTADYSAVGLEHYVIGERKSEDDLIACVGPDRHRFDNVVRRMLAFPARVLIVESTWERLEQGRWRSKVLSQSVIGSVLGWIEMGLPVILAGNHERAGRYMSRFIFLSARRRWREYRALAAGIDEQDAKPAKLSPNAVKPETVLSFAPPTEAEVEAANV